MRIELEIQLRDHCQKIRIHTQLSGAHMIFPQEQGLAIRFYYHPPTQYIDESSNITDTDKKNNTNNNNNNISEDPDGILDFCYTFQWSMVLFVLPDIMTTEPADMHLFVQRSMQLLDQPIPTTANKQHHHPPRFLVVSNTEQAIAAIVECADAITPSRCALRAKFIDNISHEHYVPKNFDTQSGSSSRRMDKEGMSAALPVDANINEKAVAEHYAKAIREWCGRANVPDGEADVILHVLPTLHQLIHAVTDTKQNSNVLNNVPIEENTKRKLRFFFTARDGDDDTHYSTDCHDGNTNIDQLDMSDRAHVPSSPSFHMAGPASVFGDHHPTVANASRVAPNPHHYRPEHGDHHPSVLTQDGMDVDFIPAVSTTMTQQYYHPQQSSGYIRPPLPQYSDGNFHHDPRDPSPFHSSANGGMPHAAVMDPSVQQYHSGIAQSADFPPQYEQHHQPYMSSLPYSEHSSTLPQQRNNHLYPRNPLYDAEMMAKVVPWGQPPPLMASHDPSRMMYPPHSRHDHNHNHMYFAPPSEHLHYQPSVTSRRISLNSYPPTPLPQNNNYNNNNSNANSFHQYHPQHRHFNIAATTPYTVTPHVGLTGNHPKPHLHPNDEENSLKRVVRRFM